MWIELHDTVREHPKIAKLARRLGVPLVQAIGHVTALWCWTLRMAPDGDLRSFDSEDIEVAAMWEGPPGAFVAAAVAVRLLDARSNGHVIHDWDDYSGSLKAAERKRKERERKQAEGPGAVVYLLWSASREMAKIGFTENLVRRLEEHEREWGERLEVVAYVPGSPESERALHAELSEERQGRSEWFKTTERLVRVCEGHFGSRDLRSKLHGSRRPTDQTDRPTRPDQNDRAIVTRAGADVDVAGLDECSRGPGGPPATEAEFREVLAEAGIALDVTRRSVRTLGHLRPSVQELRDAAAQADKSRLGDVGDRGSWVLGILKQQRANPPPKTWLDTTREWLSENTGDDMELAVGVLT